MIVFDYFNDVHILEKFCEHFNLNIVEVKKYLLKVDSIHTSYSEMVANLNLNLLNSIDDCGVHCKHITTCNDDLDSIKNYGLLRLDQVLTMDTPLKSFLSNYKIQIDPLKKLFAYKNHNWKINSSDEQCNPCLYHKEPCDKITLCDFREYMGRLHSKLYQDKGEVEFFIGGDETTIAEYQTIQEAPEILIDIAKIMKCIYPKISAYCLQAAWNKKENWKKYLMGFSIPYSWLEMNVERKSRSYYLDNCEWFKFLNYSWEDYNEDKIPLTFYINKHIAENCLSLYLEGEPLTKFGQLLPESHVSFNMIEKIEQITHF